MLKIKLPNGFSIQELSENELNGLINSHFKRVFQNRADGSLYPPPEKFKEKIAERAKNEKRFKLFLAIFKGSEFVGWHFGQATDPETYYMQNSAILEPFRNQGLYTTLLQHTLERLKEEGFQVITSTHHPNNTAVLIPKMKEGFVISSVQFHERFRFLIELKYFFNPERRKAFGKNLGLEIE